MAACLSLLAGCGVTPMASEGGADPSEPTTLTSAPASPSLDSSRFATVLRNRVNEQGLVDYEGLQRDPAILNEYLAEIGKVSPERYQAWSETARIAFLINAYNAITLKSIIDQKPLKSSIRDILGVWRVRKHPVMGKSLTLDEIEHTILRREFNEPRIHAALVCAAISCPPLRREPYAAERLDEQLDDQVRRWLASPLGLQIDREKATVKISAIFQWFAPDWKRSEKNLVTIPNHAKTSPVLNFIGRYVNPEDSAYLLAGDYKLSYLDYDWSLNRQ
jgi:hypothetical protein